MREPPSDRPVEVLVVGDDPGTVPLLGDVLSDSPVPTVRHLVATGAEALDFVHRRGDHADAPRPDLVLLAAPLSDASVEAVLADLGSDPDLRVVPVVVLAASRIAAEVAEAYDLHANAYVERPDDPDDLRDVVRSFMRFWLDVAHLPLADG